MDVSIIIVNWNTAQITCDCLDSVYQQTKDVSFEVVVIDNASSDNSVEMIKAKFPQVILIENERNRGFAAANNQGIEAAKGRYILLLNSDTLVLDNAIEKTMRYADKHLKIAVVGCQVREDLETIQMTCFRFPSPTNLFLSAFGLAKIFKYNHFFGREWMRWWYRDTEKEVDVVSGMFMLVRRKAIEQVGMMDDQYFVYCEEADWCWRFKKAGWQNIFWPDACIIHRDGGSKSSEQISIKMEVQKVKSLLCFIKKNYGYTSSLLCRLIFLLSSLIKILACLLLMIVKPLGMFQRIRKFIGICQYCLTGRYADLPS